MIYILGLGVLFLSMMILGNIVVEIACAVKEGRKVNIVKSFKE